MNQTALARAQAGDGDVFRELIDPYRGELQAHGYRILGSVADAEDVLQQGLQHLSPQQRTVLVLRDVLGFPAAETAGILGTSTTAVNSALIRARAGIRPDRDPHDVPLPRSAAEAAVVDRFVDAFERGDLKRIVSLLTDDARLTMPPEPIEFRGPRAITAFLGDRGIWGQELKLVPTRANNQPAFGYYLPDPTAPIFRASGVLVLTLRGDRVCVLTRFGDRSLLARFGLPRTLPRSC